MIIRTICMPVLMHRTEALWYCYLITLSVYTPRNCLYVHCSVETQHCSLFMILHFGTEFCLFAILLSIIPEFYIASSIETLLGTGKRWGSKSTLYPGSNTYLHHRGVTCRGLTVVPTFLVRMLGKVLDACIWLDEDQIWTCRACVVDHFFARPH